MLARIVRTLGHWLLPDYRHPLRYALREAGIETTRTI
jgi:hypothetical protein